MLKKRKIHWKACLFLVVACWFSLVLSVKRTLPSSRRLITRKTKDHFFFINGNSTLSTKSQHLLYWMTAADSIIAVCRNSYDDPPFILMPWARDDMKGGTRVVAIYSSLFYFAKLRPRLLYSVGALLRAAQLCTPVVEVFDPAIGVGVGINLCAVLARSRWVSPLVLGWVTTRAIWVFLGARWPGNAKVPILISIRNPSHQGKQ